MIFFWKNCLFLLILVHFLAKSTFKTINFIKILYIRNLGACGPFYYIIKLSFIYKIRQKNCM